MKLVIVGGGIAGLSAAFHAAQRAPHAGITILESGPRWGGKIVTDRVSHAEGRFIIEGGPDTFLATKPWGVALCTELGLGDRLHGTNPHQRNTYVLHDGRLLPLPNGLAMMLPSDINSILRSGLISWMGKARMGLDFLLPPKGPVQDESLGGFVSRRLGREAYENLIEPLMSGIYAGDGDALSLACTFPYLRDLELRYGSLARGALELRKQSEGRASAGSRSAFLTPTTGLAEIVERLIAQLTARGTSLRLNTTAQAVEKTAANTWSVALADGTCLEAEAVILATPAYVSGSLVASLDPGLASDLYRIPYVSTATVSLAYRISDVPRDLDGYGYVIPRREDRKALACTWTSTKFPHRAPAGYALIRVFVGRAGQALPAFNAGDAAADGVLLELAREELQITLGITADPIISRAHRWELAMPQYNLGHPALLERIDAALGTHQGLALAGNGYRGIGIPDCIHSGELAADRILEYSGINDLSEGRKRDPVPPSAHIYLEAR